MSGVFLGVVVGFVFCAAVRGFAAPRNAPAKGSEKLRQFRAGAATSNITPRLGTSINGYFNDRRAAHIHDELRARCLVLDDGQTRLGIGAIPCEVFAETGLAIKQQSPFKPTFTIELANGCNGYLPTPPQHKLGGYETWRVRSSYLETEAAPKIFDTLMRLFQQLR